MQFWLVKSEPSKYSFNDLLKDTKTIWDGVRNHQAKKYLSQMKLNDTLLFYHSNSTEKGIIGIAKVIKESYPDPSDNKWIVVDIAPSKNLDKLVSLQEIKSNSKLQSLMLIKQPRLSVMPISKEEFNEIISLAKKL